MIVDYEELMYKNVVWHTYEIYYKDFEKALEDFNQKLISANLTVNGPLFYSLNNIPHDDLFGVYFYLMAIFYIGQNFNVSEFSLMTFTYATLAFGVLVIVLTSIRFYILLKKGHYRSGSKKDKLRFKAESGVRSYLPIIIIIVSVGFLFIIQYLVRVFGLAEVQTIFMMMISILLFYTMLFVLPEQLVLLYCKCRFDSFNYSKNGNLYPLGRKGA